jgi:hypothetical protein
MKHALMGLAVTIALSWAGPARGAEPYLEFVEGLRKRELADYALIYLDQLEKRSDVPAEIKAVIPYERGITLIESSGQSRNPEVQTRMLDQARAYLEQFVKASPNHPNAGRANTELALVLVQKGKVERYQSQSPSNLAKKAEFQKRARAYFGEAQKTFQAAHDRYKEALDKSEKGNIPKTDPRFQAREEVLTNFINAQFHLAVLMYEEAQTWDKGSPENKKRLTEAAAAFETINARYRSMIGGLYARMYEGKCFEEQDEIGKGLGIYKELLEHGSGEKEKATGALKKLQDQVLHFRLVCLNREQKKDYKLVVDEAQKWIKENRSNLSTPTGLGIQWEMVRALEFLGKKEDASDADRSRDLNLALTTARTINKFAGEYKDASSVMIQRLMAALKRETADPKDFGAAFGIAQSMVPDINKKITELREAPDSEKPRLAADLQPQIRECARILQIGLALVGPKDDIKEVNRARYWLAYAFYSMRDGPDRSYDGAVAAEFVAQKCVESQPDLALDAAYLAEAAYIQAYRREPEAQRPAALKRIIAAGNFLTEKWPTNDKANDARITLGEFYRENRQPAEAARWFMQVPESAPQYLQAQVEAGSAYWYAYITESIRPEAERKPKEELDELLKQSQEILRTALAKFEAQLPGDVSQVDEPKLDKLTRAKVNYASMLNNAGDYKGALAMLTEGPLSVAAATAAPGGDDSKRPAKGPIYSRQYAGLAQQGVLRAYIGLADLDKARMTMRELEKIEGAGGGGASLTRIYLDLGKELEKEVERLQAGHDPRLADVIKSFETFLEDMSNRKDGQDLGSLVWIAETYKALGEGLEQGDSAKAESYFGKAVAALEQLIELGARQPGVIPPEALPGVELRIVRCKRRQKRFDEAHELLLTVLNDRAKALDVQEEAALLFQDWALRGGPEDQKKWEIAIKGGAGAKKKNRDEKVWGWQGLAVKLQASLQNKRDPEYERQFLDASFSTAWCWYKYAGASTGGKRKERLAEAEKAVQRTSGLVPSLGGSETWAKFNQLHRDIQQEMLDLGMDEMRGKQVTDLERTREEKAAAKKKAAEEIAMASADDGGSTAAKPKKKSKSKSGGKTNAKGKTSEAIGLWPMVAVVVGIALVGCGGWLYLARGKKKPRRRIVDEPEDIFGEPKFPSARTRR